MAPAGRPTRDRILDAALELFGTRGVDAVSLDDIAAVVGVRKQTVLYWFTSKEELLDAVLHRSADELIVAIDAAVRRAGPGFAQIEAVVRVVFRAAVRRPELLGLVRELDRLGPSVTTLRQRMAPLVDRAVGYLEREMEAGRLRPADPRLTLALAYATVVGVATDPQMLAACGWEPSISGLRRLRGALLDQLRSSMSRTSDQ